MMDYFNLMLLCVVSLLPLALLKKYAAEQAVLLTLALVLLVIFRCITMAAPLLASLERLFLTAGVEGEYIAILLRTVAAALITRLCSNLCRDGGSQAMATAVEFAGAVAALLIAMPLLEAVTNLLNGYFS